MLEQLGSIPTSGSWLQLPVSREAEWVTQVIGWLPPTWETWVVLPAPSSWGGSWPSLTIARHLGSEQADGSSCVCAHKNIYVYIHIYVYISAFQIHFFKEICIRMIVFLMNKG